MHVTLILFFLLNNSVLTVTVGPFDSMERCAAAGNNTGLPVSSDTKDAAAPRAAAWRCISHD